jgi:DNA-directed RNA polymerase beta' subunit
VTADQDIFKKILGKIPGFSGYIERQNRRSADKILRETIASRFEEIWQRISQVQRDFISQGAIAYVDDMEAAAIKFRQFIDRVRNAAYGYSGFFDAVKVNEEELANIYQYDLAMLEMVDGVNRAIDNVEASVGTDGLPAAIRNLTALARQCVETFDHRAEVILSGSQQASQ